MMKKCTIWGAVAPLMTTAIVGCTSDETTSATPNPTICPVDTDSVMSNENNELRSIVLTRSEQQLVNHSNSFAFKLFRKISSNQSEIVSPISITYALGMLNNGAAGETQAQINNVLGFGETGADGINDFCRKMLTEAPTLDRLNISVYNRAE